ncbi:MAG TPA: hypothetical protein VHR45_25500 [Thermoanaerobaculia bacterium]|nr:hypothetical protein [Thermoanaerobaculia bacterium]
MIETFIVRIIFVGLVAFVPINPAQPGAPLSLKVLLPDVRGPVFASDGCRIPPHLPALFVEADSCKHGSYDCKADAELGKAFQGTPCNPSTEDGLVSNVNGPFSLLDQQITFTTPADAARLQFATRKKRAPPLPVNAHDSTSFSWVAGTQAGYTIDRNCLSGRPGICPIAARAIIPNGNISSCHLTEAVADGGTKSVCSYKFAPLFKARLKGLGSQALADAVMVAFTLPRTSNVTLHLSSIKESAESEIVLSPGKRAFVNIWVVNVPGEKEDHFDKCNDHDLGKHFELYYNIAARDAKGKPLPLAKRPIPHATKTCLPYERIQPDPKTAEGCPLLNFVNTKNKVMASADDEARFVSDSCKECKKEEGCYPGNKTACGAQKFPPWPPH